jgi:hypothetical protein
MFTLWDFNELDSSDMGEKSWEFETMEELETFEQTLPEKIRSVTFE